MAVNKDVPTKYNNIDITLDNLPELANIIIPIFCDKYKVDNLATVSTNIFNACMAFIAQTLHIKELALYKNEYNNNDSYDLDKLNKGIDQYIILCQLYDSSVSILGASNYLAIEDTYLYKLSQETTPRNYNNNVMYRSDANYQNRPQKEKSDIVGQQLYEKIARYEEMTLLNSKKYNDLRVIARLNRITGGSYRDYTQVDTMQVQGSTPAQLAEKYKDIALQEQILPELPKVEE